MVKKRILPVIVCTWEALEGAAEDGPPVIYADNALYTQDPAGVRELLGEQGYVLSSKPGKQGVFFLLNRGEGCFRDELHEIHDPLNIL